MITAIHGRLTREHLADAALFAGIEPTLMLTNGEGTKWPEGIPCETVEPCEKLPGETGVFQSHWRMLIRAEALICVGKNEHLVASAKRMPGLLIYEA